MTRLPTPPQSHPPGYTQSEDGSSMEILNVNKPFKALIVERTTTDGHKLYLHKDGWWRKEPHQVLDGTLHNTGYFKKIKKVVKALELAKGLAEAGL